jgi:hypothetical protein
MCDDASPAGAWSLRLCHAVLEVTAICGCTIIFLRLPTGPLASDLHWKGQGGRHGNTDADLGMPHGRC